VDNCKNVGNNGSAGLNQGAGFDNLVPDGDINHANEGLTTTTATQQYLTDVVEVVGAIGDWSIGSHAATNSKPNYLEYIGSGTYEDAQARYNIIGNTLSGKTITCVFRLKASATPPTALKVKVLADGVTEKIASAVISGITTGFLYYRVDIVVPLYEATYTEITLVNDTDEVFNLTIDSFRYIFKPDNLLANLIPDWIRHDENALLTLPLVQAYFWRINAASVAFRSFIGATLNTTDFSITIPISQVKTPNVLFVSAGVVVLGGIGTLSAFNSATAWLQGQTVLLTFKVTSTTASHAGQIRFSSGSGYIALDARFKV
jgi:hypothetical protein